MIRILWLAALLLLVSCESPTAPPEQAVRPSFRSSACDVLDGNPDCPKAFIGAGTATAGAAATCFGKTPGIGCVGAVTGTAKAWESWWTMPSKPVLGAGDDFIAWVAGSMYGGGGASGGPVVYPIVRVF